MIVFLPGLLRFKDEYQHLISRLELLCGESLSFLDLPGCDRAISTKCDGTSLHAGEILEPFLARSERIYLVGHSMGAGIARSFAKRVLHQRPDSHNIDLLVEVDPRFHKVNFSDQLIPELPNSFVSETEAIEFAGSMSWSPAQDFLRFYSRGQDQVLRLRIDVEQVNRFLRFGGSYQLLETWESLGDCFPIKVIRTERLSLISEEEWRKIRSSGLADCESVASLSHAVASKAEQEILAELIADQVLRVRGPKT